MSDLSMEKESNTSKHALEEALLEKDDPLEVVSNVEVLPPLKDDRDAKYDVKTEKPWHRLLAYLLLQGTTIKQAAEQLGKTKEHCYTVKRQPWFKQLSAQLAAAHADHNVIDLLEGCSVEAVMTLSDIAADPEIAPSTRAGAANSLLNQYFKNKPTPQEAQPEDPKAELEELDRRLEELESSTAVAEPKET